MNEPIISVSGLRGIVGDSLTPEVVLRYAGAFAEGLPPGPVVIARDSRPSGAAFVEMLRGALAACGRSVIDGGVLPTPTVGVLVRETRAAGGIQISASHNPPPYNGMKLFSAEGRVIPAAAGEKVLDRYGRVARGQPLRWAAHDGFGRTAQAEEPLTRHLSLVLDQVDVERIRSKRFRVLLDVNGGAGGKLGRRLLEELGATVQILGEAPSGNFVHPAEPTAENLAGVQDHARAFEAAVGFCQDPDADRLAILDEQGRYIGEEYTLALCLAHVLRRRPGPVVTNCASSRMSEDLASRFGVRFVRSAVGEANVVDAMLASGAAFGGEGNGGPIDPEVGLVRDSFVGMALVLDYLAAEGVALSGLVEQLPHYEIHKTKVTLEPEQLAGALRKLTAHFADAQIDRKDGVRLDWPGRWLLVRASNTEPIVRIIAEARSRSEAEQLCAAAERAMTT